VIDTSRDTERRSAPSASGCPQAEEALRALLAGDVGAELLALHVLRFQPLADRLRCMGPGLVRPRDRATARRALAGLLRQG